MKTTTKIIRARRTPKVTRTDSPTAAMAGWPNVQALSDYRLELRERFALAMAPVLAAEFMTTDAWGDRYEDLACTLWSIADAFTRNEPK